VDATITPNKGAMMSRVLGSVLMVSTLTKLTTYLVGTLLSEGETLEPECVDELCIGKHPFSCDLIEDQVETFSSANSYHEEARREGRGRKEGQIMSSGEYRTLGMTKSISGHLGEKHREILEVLRQTRLYFAAQGRLLFSRYFPAQQNK
jgi:hypothetical protein